MISLLCIRDVIMLQDNRVAFKAGKVYDFFLSSSGEISRTTDKGVHIFRAIGPESWSTYFKYQVEEV